MLSIARSGEASSQWEVLTTTGPACTGDFTGGEHALYSQATLGSQGDLAVQPQHTRGLLLCDNVSSGILELAVTRSRSCVDNTDLKTKEV